MREAYKKYFAHLCAVLFALFMGTFAVRNAIVKAFADSDPSLSEMWWPSHPATLAAVAMEQVGSAAARGQAPSEGTQFLLNKLASHSPLSSEPFLVRGAVALRKGEQAQGQRLIAAAKVRDPRSIPARYLLADSYLRTNQIPRALSELATLTRLAPSFSQPLAPALAQYAHEPGAPQQLRQILRDNPQLENVLLSELASDPRNADLVLALARGQQRTDTVAPWQQRLVSTLIAAGAYDRAYAVWQKFGFAGESDDAFTFRRAPVQSPFAWTFAQESAGTAESVDGRLEIIFSGTKSLTLASKIARLTPGIYEMRTEIAGDTPESVRWSVICLPGDRQVVDAPLSTARSGVLASQFQVPAECRAQRLELQGQAETFPATSEFSIADFDVKRVSQQ